jgi:hypothetical protein
MSTSRTSLTFRDGESLIDTLPQRAAAAGLPVPGFWTGPLPHASTPSAGPERSYDD